jgi:hypothetical protein
VCCGIDSAARRRRAAELRVRQPGSSDQPTVLFGEDFENNPRPTVTPLTSYHGAPPIGETYKTDPAVA